MRLLLIAAFLALSIALTGCVNSLIFHPPRAMKTIWLTANENFAAEFGEAQKHFVCRILSSMAGRS